MVICSSPAKFVTARELHTSSSGVAESSKHVVKKSMFIAGPEQFVCCQRERMACDPDAEQLGQGHGCDHTD